MSIDIQNAARALQIAKRAQPELAKLKKATDGFEAVFLKKLFSQTRSIVKETQFGETFGKEIYNDMFDEAMANAAAKSKTLGMGDLLYRQFAPRVISQVTTQVKQEAKTHKDQ
jgi:Rod binding domain-containing protein